MKLIYDFIGGRSLTFAWFCIVAATALAFKGHLDTSYAAVITALSGFVVWRAVKEDSASSQ